MRFLVCVFVVSPHNAVCLCWRQCHCLILCLMFPFRMYLCFLACAFLSLCAMLLDCIRFSVVSIFAHLCLVCCVRIEDCLSSLPSVSVRERLLSVCGSSINGKTPKREAFFLLHQYNTISCAGLPLHLKPLPFKNEVM